MFWLKKTFGYLLMPLQASLLLLLIGLWRSLRHRGAGRVWLLLGFLLLAVTSNKMVGNRLITSLESDFAAVPELTAGAELPPDLAACTAIAVLGGGHAPAVGVSATNQLSASALARVTEGVRLALALPETTLILCGPGRPGEPTHAEVLQAAAVSLGLPIERTALLPEVRDTAGEIAALKAQLGEARVAVVTSAWHLRRAMMEARLKELRAVPVPTDFAYRRKDRLEWTDFLWDLSGLDRSTKAIHEYLGQGWVRLRRGFDRPPPVEHPATPPEGPSDDLARL